MAWVVVMATVYDDCLCLKATVYIRLIYETATIHLRKQTQYKDLKNFLLRRILRCIAAFAPEIGVPGGNSHIHLPLSDRTNISK